MREEEHPNKGVEGGWSNKEVKEWSLGRDQ
jgi:hypothetical protein